VGGIGTTLAYTPGMTNAAHTTLTELIETAYAVPRGYRWSVDANVRADLIREFTRNYTDAASECARLLAQIEGADPASVTVDADYTDALIERWTWYVELKALGAEIPS
jgi:hypothetical protein